MYVNMYGDALPLKTNMSRQWIFALKGTLK